MKSERIEVRCTPEEKDAWTEKAYPLTISQYVRFLLNEATSMSTASSGSSRAS